MWVLQPAARIDLIKGARVCVCVWGGGISVLFRSDSSSRGVSVRLPM